MQKTLKFFRTGKTCEVQVKLKDERLSIVGLIYEGDTLLENEENLLHGGQCKKEAKKFIPDLLYQIWDRWHLNDMRAGTPAQRKLLRELFTVCPNANYDQQCEFLEQRDLLFDGDYKYGSAWLKEELPQDVIDYVHSL
jgi:hypothetical protein